MRSKKTNPRDMLVEIQLDVAVLKADMKWVKKIVLIILTLLIGLLAKDIYLVF